MEILAGAHLQAVAARENTTTQSSIGAPNSPPNHTLTMRRLPRLRSAAAAGFLPASTPSGALRAPAAAAFGSPSTLSSTPRLTTSSPLQRQAQRSLSTTPTRRAQPQSQAEPHAAAAEEQQDDQLATYPDEDLYPPPAAAAEIPTQLVYPRQLTTAPAAADVTDPAYRPADTADGLEEVGGLADWWEQPAHWGDAEGGPGRLVHAVVNPFGPVARVADPVVLEVLARRAVVEALAVAGARVKRKVVDRLFAASADGLHGLEEVLRVEIVAGPDGAAALSTEGGKRVWEVLQSATARKEVQQPREQQQAPAAEVEKAQETEVEVVQEEVQASEVLNDETVAPATKLAPSEAEALIQSWSREWRKAELRDPVVKFFVRCHP